MTGAPGRAAVASGSLAAQPIIEVRDASVTYPGAVPVHALRGASVAVGPGEMVAIVGPSGSGKSTLLGILGLLDRPTSGSVVVGGTDATGLDDGERSKRRRELLGFVFQQFHLIEHLTALANVEVALLYRGLSPRERRDRARGALARVGLEHRSGHRPTRLSGGEQQRVAIARALAAEPALVLADEPTGNLDSVNARHVLDLLQSLVADGMAVVLVTHDERIARQAGRRIELLDGAIVSDG